MHKLAKSRTVSKKVEQKKKLSKTAKLNIIQFSVIGIILIVALYIPVKYSTAANNRIINKMTDAITGEVGGIMASNVDVGIEGYDYKVKSSQTYIMEQGDEQLNRLKRYQELGVLETNVDLDDLWAVYYAYYSDNYRENLELYKQLTMWFSELQKKDAEGFECTCTGEDCLFVSELSDIVAIDINELKKSNAHTVYHKQVAESEQTLELTDKELQQAYEAYIITNPEYVDELVLNFTCINNNIIENSPRIGNWALNGKDWLVRWCLGNIKYTKTFYKAEVAELMKYIDFTTDDGLITDEIVALVPNALLSFGVDKDGLSTGNTTIVNVTNVENLEEWLKDVDITAPYKNINTDAQFIDCGYAQLHWEIEHIDYMNNLPTFEELKENEEWVKATRTRLIEQAIWQMFYSGE